MGNSAQLYTRGQHGRADRRALVLLFLHQDGAALLIGRAAQITRRDRLEEQGATGSHRKAQDGRGASGAAVPPAQPDGHQDGHQGPAWPRRVCAH